VQAHLVGEALPKPSTLVGLAMPRNSHHQWHKFGMKLKAPAAQDCLFKLLMQDANGFQLIDRISIQPVTDRQVDSLMTFLEGQKTP